MENLEELEKQYNEAKEQMDWQKMAAIMLKVYPEHNGLDRNISQVDNKVF